MANDIRQLNEAYQNVKESSGADCFFYEKEPGKWYYDIQDYPYGETSKYTTHGPFPDFRAAEKHLSGHYQNPGGYGIKALPCKDHEPYSPRYTTQKFCAKCGKFLGEADDFPKNPKYGDRFWYPNVGEIAYMRMKDDKSRDAIFAKTERGWVLWDKQITLSLDDKKLKTAAVW